LQVLGLDPVLVTVAICIIGVSYRILTGMAGKSWSEFNPTMAMTTFMLGIVTSIGLVAPIIDALPDNLSSTLQMAAVVGQIGLVMGIDAGVRKGQKVAQAIKEKKEHNLDEEPEPIDPEDDLPPGKIVENQS
jgi:hypothetical protein